MATKQFDADACSRYRLDALLIATGSLPPGVAVRVVVNTDKITRADAINAPNLVSKTLGTSSDWPME